MKEVRGKIRDHKSDKSDIVFRKNRSGLDKNGTRWINHLIEKGTEPWLLATPNNLCGNILHIFRS